VSVARGCTVLLGGARSGKSDLAVRLGREWAGAVHVVVTAEALDDDMAARIARHRADRPAEWLLTEAPVALEEGLAGVAHDALAIVDCLTLWVANLMGAGLDDGEVVRWASAFAAVAAGRTGPTIVVTNEVGMGVHPDTDLGRRYRDLLGRVNAFVVARADRALLLVAGRAVVLVDPMEELS
jgi:adenosyl cobinamide kinase/adenosyl cobinamide phosphate guanylyltransferase